MGRHSFQTAGGRLLIVLFIAVFAAIAAVAAWQAVTQTGSSPKFDAAGTIQPTASIRVTCQDRGTDAATLQRAINSSPVGSAIEFQGGTCLLTTGLTLPGNRTYTGESTTGTVLRQQGSARFMLASSAYVDNAPTTGDPLSIRDLTVACDGSGSTDGILLMNWQVDVEHVDISGCGGSGIVDTNTNSSGKAITNTSVNSRFDNNFITNSGQFGFYVHDSGNSVTDGFLQNNQIASSRLDAVHLDNAEGWNISGNHLYNVGGNAIRANRLYGTTISSNYIEDFGDGKQSGTWYGILGTAQDGAGSAILGNKIFNDQAGTGGSYVYVGIAQTNSGTGHLSVTGNVIMGDGRGTGLSVSGGANSLMVASSGNQVSKVHTVQVGAPSATLTGGS
jgi:hypothetical protein